MLDAIEEGICEEDSYHNKKKLFQEIFIKKINFYDEFY